MEWIISHQSALEFWRRTKAEVSLAGNKLCAINPPIKPLHEKELKSENLCNLTMPLHVLTGSGNARKVSRKMQCHVSSGEFPKESFIQMASGLTVSSPELCFLQMAGELSLTDIVTLGYEFCGSYRLDSGNEPDKGFRTDLPLTCVARLDSYLAKASGLKGCTNARRALRFIADGSASPMETVLTVLLTFPYRLGGYGFSLPLLNYRVDVPVGTTKGAGKSTYYCDLYWPTGQLDVEYDSDAYHTGSDRIAKDAIRRNALLNAGVTVVTVSRKQIIEALRFRELAELLSKLLGKRLQYPRKEFAFRHAKLLKQLLPKETSARH
jgi:hypothetical protein